MLLAAAALAACSDTTEPLDTADAPAALIAEAGNGQAGVIGAPLAQRLVVRVTDQAGRGVPDVTVAWAATGGSVSAATTLTDPLGRAEVEWTLAGRSGVDTATAAVDGLAPVRFEAVVRPVAGGFVFRYVDAGSYHACGILTTEQAVCWGYDGDGQLGTGSGTTDTPMPVPGDHAFRITSGGRYHSCAVTLSGTALCWGANPDGRLNADAPVTWRTIGAGLTHTCALSIAQEVWCWGYNGQGQIGAGGAGPGATVEEPAFVGAGYRAIAAGGQHTCALTSGGAARCWGWNASGQLGNDATADADLPVTVAGGHTFRTDPAVVPHAPDPDFYVPGHGNLTAGYAHTCAIRTDGAALCWGVNQDGQLGDGTTTSRDTPVVVSGGLEFTALSAGYRHTCGLAADGAAWCWGANEYGQLGDGTTTPQSEPVPVSGGMTFQAISAGELSSCGVTTAGVAYCWGGNEYGQLGTGSRAHSAVPVRVATQP
jgi:alpha-tubulin suppressor-like RCC1 family protein